MSSPPVWSYVHLDDLGSVSAGLKQQFYQQLKYLRDLRDGWKTLELPRSWTQNLQEYSPGVLYDGFNSFLGRLYMRSIEDCLIQVDDSELEARSPYGLFPTFCLSSDRYNPTHQLQHYYRATCNKSSMSLSQVTQIMEDEEDEFYAQNAVATALDGIPSTLVRRSNLRISQTRAQDGTNEPTVFDLVDVDFAVLYTALGASQSASIRRFKRLPISPFNPALVLCARSSRTWNAHCPQEAGLETIVHHLAITASYSLPSLHAVWAHRMRHSMDRPQGGALWKVDDEGGGLPSWAMLIGIIYDPAAIHFVAHIPYRSLDACDQPRYLSVHFESLPFPELSPEEVSQHFLCDRYRVAVALLCIQQHVFRLTSLWDDVCQTKEEYELYATHLRSLDDKSEPGTPTPSELYSGEEYFDDDFVIDYDEDVESGPPKVPYEEIEEWRGAIETDSQCLSQATCCSINNAELVVSTDLVEASVLL